MLHKNISSTQYVFYDVMGRKQVVKPNELIEDSLVPEVINMSTFVPYGIRRTPTLPNGGKSDGNRQESAGK